MSNLLGILGNKVGMTQIFTQKGNVVPVTIIKAGPCYISQIKSVKNNDYNSIQIGYQNILKFKLNKPESGHLKNLNYLFLKYLKEYTVENSDDYTLGQIINVTSFKEGDFVNITGNSIGKGFAGNIKRNNFQCGPMSHGSKNHREPGSIGQSTTPGRVFPGKRMAGRLGGVKVTALKLKILKVDIENNLLTVKGSIPGKSGNILSIQLV